MSEVLQNWHSCAENWPRERTAGKAVNALIVAVWRVVAWDGIEPPTRGFSGLRAATAIGANAC